MRFKRRNDEPADAGAATDPEDVEDGQVEEPGTGAAASAPGPRDISEDPHFGDAENVVDLGSLLIPMREGLDLRLQVDESNGLVLAALVLSEEGMLELRAFAAPRNGDLWADVRREIAADTSQRGGTASEREGALGPELYCEVQVQMDDGSTGVQPSRILGWNGPRWFLRGALLGAPAMQPDAAGPWEELFSQIVVRRGEIAMPPGDALPLQLPPEAIRLDAPE
ncbi:MAG TPA: DUF3710 domain-containing protein [Marmoricola sp.]